MAGQEIGWVDVNSSNIELAKRLEYGLKQAFTDGNFDKLFNTHPSSVRVLLNLN